MKRSFFLYMLFFSLNAYAQLPAVLKGIVQDSISGDALGGAVVQIAGTTYSARTTSDGHFVISMDISEPFTASIRVYFTGYEEKVIHALIRPARSVELNIQMTPTFYMYDEVTIPGTLSPDTVYGSTAMNVSDFAFFRDSLLLLTYKSEKRWKRQEESKTTLYDGGELILIDEHRKEIARCTIPEPFERFYKGYFDEVYLIGREKVYEVRLNGGLSLSPVAPDYFREWIEPIVDSIGSVVYFSTFNPDFPAFEYKSFDRQDSTFNTLRYLLDEKIMELFRSEFKYLGPKEKLKAFRYELETGIDKEIVAAYISGFQNSLYYSPLNIPLVVSNDTLLIFDHHHDKLLRYDCRGSAIDSSFISYHKTTGAEKWGGKVIRDDITGEVYTFNSKNGYTSVYRVNTGDGTYSPAAQLSYRYVENVGVRNGYVYYIYRPFESSQKRFLYKEKAGL